AGGAEEVHGEPRAVARRDVERGPLPAVVDGLRIAFVFAKARDALRLLSLRGRIRGQGRSGRKEETGEGAAEHLHQRTSRMVPLLYARAQGGFPRTSRLCLHRSEIYSFCDEARFRHSEQHLHRYGMRLHQGENFLHQRGLHLHQGERLHHHGDFLPHHGERRPHHSDFLPHHGKRRPHQGEQRPHYGERRFHHGERRPHHSERLRHHGDFLHHHGERRLHHGERRPHHGERRFHHGDFLPHPGERRPHHGEPRPHR